MGNRNCSCRGTPFSSYRPTCFVMRFGGRCLLQLDHVSLLPCEALGPFGPASRLEIRSFLSSAPSALRERNDCVIHISSGRGVRRSPKWLIRLSRSTKVQRGDCRQILSRLWPKCKMIRFQQTPGNQSTRQCASSRIPTYPSGTAGMNVCSFQKGSIPFVRFRTADSISAQTVAFLR